MIPAAPIQMVDYKEFESITETLGKRWGRPSENGYSIWQRYHEELCRVAGRFGKVGYDPRDAPAFYHSGDWFHELADGFAIEDPRNFSHHVFYEFQEVVLKHHPDASLALWGNEMRWEDRGSISPLYGLVVLIRPSAIHVSWMLENAEGCVRKLRDSGVEFESWRC